VLSEDPPSVCEACVYTVVPSVQYWVDGVCFDLETGITNMRSSDLAWLHFFLLCSIIVDPLAVFADRDRWYIKDWITQQGLLNEVCSRIFGDMLEIEMVCD
jgi:hypothetical protein